MIEIEILCIADIHGDRDAVQRLKEYARDNSFENILILGDFPGYGKFRDREKSLDEVRFVLNLLSDYRIMAIPGNCDMPEVLSLFDEYNVNLHEKSRVFDGVTIAGFGAASPTPYNTPFEMEEDLIYEKLEKLLNNLETERIILAVHNPPLNTACDVNRLGIHVGSKAIRDIVVKFQPEMLVSSHIHESGGSADVLGKTRVVNIGSLSHGKFGVIYLDRDIDIKLGEM